MKNKVLITLLGFFVCFATTVHAIEMAEQEMDPAQAQMMQQWEKFMTPSEGHEILAKLIGKWSHTLKHWMAPDAPAEENTGESEITWIMGGRYVQHEVKSEWNGQPFEGLGIIGYDNITKEYNTVWLDNMGTGIMQANGNYDAEKKSIGEAGHFSCPMTNSQRNYKAVTTFVDDNTFTYETFMTDENGNEFRSMLITYTKN